MEFKSIFKLGYIVDIQMIQASGEADEDYCLFKSRYLCDLLVVLVGDAGVGKTHLLNR